MHCDHQLDWGYYVWKCVLDEVRYSFYYMVLVYHTVLLVFELYFGTGAVISWTSSNLVDQLWPTQWGPSHTIVHQRLVRLLRHMLARILSFLFTTFLSIPLSGSIWCVYIQNQSSVRVVGKHCQPRVSLRLAAETKQTRFLNSWNTILANEEVASSVHCDHRCGRTPEHFCLVLSP